MRKVFMESELKILVSPSEAEGHMVKNPEGPPQLGKGQSRSVSQQPGRRQSELAKTELEQILTEKNAVRKYPCS